MNSKKALFVLFAIIILLLAGVFTYKTSKAGNEFRMNKANELLEKSKNTTETQGKLTFLIQSDLLAPTEEKKFKIADLYLSLNQFENAENYLNKVKNESGYYKYAEAALETAKYDIAKVYIDKIDNKEVKTELLIFEQFSQGNESKLTELPLSPITALGVLSRAINTDDFTANPSKSLLGEKINDIITKTSGKTNQKLQIADMFISENQPNLARYILKNLEKEHSGSKDLYLIWARSYEKEGAYDKALEYAKKAIQKDPSDLDSYKTALRYTEIIEDSAEQDYLNIMIKYLKNIQS